MNSETPTTLEPSNAEPRQPPVGFFCLDVATKSRPRMIVAAGRLSLQEIALRAAELSGADGIGTEGFRTSEEAGW